MLNRPTKAISSSRNNVGSQNEITIKTCYGLIQRNSPLTFSIEQPRRDINRETLRNNRIFKDCHVGSAFKLLTLKGPGDDRYASQSPVLPRLKNDPEPEPIGRFGVMSYTPR
jgi:hypothetical protein